VHAGLNAPRLSNGDADVARRLRDLPTECAPPFAWKELERRRTTEPTSRGGGASMAAAIVLLIAVLGLVARSASDRQPSFSREVNAAFDAAASQRYTNWYYADGAKASERWLASLPAEPTVVSVGTRLAVSNLEDRIAFVDDSLSIERIEGAQPSRLMALQQQRAQLIHSLAQVRYAEQLAAGAR
jgi:hypothetical protein